MQAGPLTGMSCLCYELKNSFFKRRANSMYCFRNVCNTLGYRHQQFALYTNLSGSHIRDFVTVQTQSIVPVFTLSCIDAMDRASEVPRLPKRTGDNKNKQNADDLLKLFTLIDEQNLSGSLAVFAAVDLQRLPFLSPDGINLVSMLRTMQSFEQRLNAMEKCYTRQANLYGIVEVSHALSGDW